MNTRTGFFTGLMLVMAMSLLLTGCFDDDAPPAVTTPETVYYVHSADYSTYKIDSISYADGALTTSQNILSISGSAGIRSPQMYKSRMMLIDSSANGNLVVCNPADGSEITRLALGNADGNTSDKDYPQEMCIYGGMAWIALRGDEMASPAQNESLLAVVSLANPDSPQLVTTVQLTGNQPQNVRVYNGKIYVTCQDSASMSGSKVCVVDPQTRQQVASYNVGENPADLALQSGIVYTYDSKWFGGSNASISKVNADGTVNTVTSGFPDRGGALAPIYGGSLAVTADAAFVLLGRYEGYTARMYLCSLDKTTLACDVISDLCYVWVGANNGYVVQAQRGTAVDGTTLTIEWCDATGTQKTSTTLAADSDMTFWFNR